jgi:hypothetical protein
MSDVLDFNNAGGQRSFDVVPDNTICILQMVIKPGGAGPGGWLTPANTAKGYSEHLACEFTIVEGEHAKRKLWARYTVASPDRATYGEAIDISLGVLKAILESAHGFRPDDKSEAAEAARRVSSWGDFDQLRFPARLGIEPPKNGYAAKNVIKEVITPERQAWRKVEQIDRDLLGQPSGAAAAPSGPSQAGETPPANKIARPDWAK